MEKLFDKEEAEKLSGPALDTAREFLIEGLREATGIRLEYFADPETLALGSTIHCTDIRTEVPLKAEYALSWKGFIGSSDCRDDGLLVFGAHLFPLIGGVRTCLQRTHSGTQTYDYAFRYLMLTKECGWEDRGWQVDAYGEFEHWYC